MRVDKNKPMEVVWHMLHNEDRIFQVELVTGKDWETTRWDREDEPAIWVKRLDCQKFPTGGMKIAFKPEGSPSNGYPKPAILRNVKENIMENEYHDFIPYAAASFPPFPFFAKFIDTKGDTFTRKCTSAASLPYSDLTLAVAFQKVDPLRVEAQRLLAKVQDRVALADVTSVIVEVLREQGFNEKVDVNPDNGRMPTWFLALLEECGIFTSAHRMDVWNWYMDTHNSNSTAWKLPTALARKLDNRLLSFRPWTGGGQLVITPYGHGLAVTNAKKVYWMWKDRDFRSTYGMGSHENNGGYKPNYAKRTITINSKGVEIGCQKIPHMAFTRLAERLGWPDKDPYGY